MKPLRADIDTDRLFFESRTEDASGKTPLFVEIHEEDGAFYLFRLRADGVCVGDTWHVTIEEAKDQAAFEYGVGPSDWRSSPDVEV